MGARRGANHYATVAVHWRPHHKSPRRGRGPSVARCRSRHMETLRVVDTSDERGQTRHGLLQHVPPQLGEVRRHLRSLSTHTMCA